MIKRWFLVRSCDIGDLVCERCFHGIIILKAECAVEKKCILHTVWALYHKHNKSTLLCVDSNASTESFKISCDVLKFTHVNLAVRMPVCISQTMTFIPVYKSWSVSDLSSPNFNKSHTSKGLGTERQSAREEGVSELVRVKKRTTRSCLFQFRESRWEVIFYSSWGSTSHLLAQMPNEYGSRAVLSPH